MSSTRPPYLLYTLLLVAVIGLGGLGYLTVTQVSKITMLMEERQYFLTESNGALEKLALASSTIAELENELLTVRDELENLADDYQDERNRNEEFEDQLRELAGTVGDLDKLSKTDEELLQKYSKVYFLNENYIPERLRQIDADLVLPGKGDQYFHANAIGQLERMIEAAAAAGHDLKVVSAYRSFETQTELKGQYTQVYGSGANAFSADQGYSEHQLGTAVDVTTPEVGGAYNSFAQTAA